MYENPELAYEERESSARLSAFLGRSGFRVEYPAYGLETAFVARAGSKGPELVICAEYDALPGVGQACGHNIIATAALGAGHALRPLAEELGFRLTILGTPAEEKYGGKVDLIEAGAFREAAAAMMIHPSPLNVVDPNVIAVNHLDVEFFGKAAHASAYPHLGLNALDAFVQAYVGISNLRQHILPTDKIHGIITHGGDAANIVPAYTKSTWYVRGQERGRLDELMPRVTACFEAAAGATGCRCEWAQIGHTYEDMVSNPLMTELFSSNAASLGRTMLRGADLPPSQTGSTDMGNVSKVVPTIHPMIGIDSLPAVNHQPEFAAHTIGPSGELAIRDGALGMAFTVIDLAAGNRWDDL
jgi:amidohydrolase